MSLCSALLPSRACAFGHLRTPLSCGRQRLLPLSVSPSLQKCRKLRSRPLCARRGFGGEPTVAEVEDSAPTDLCLYDLALRSQAFGVVGKLEWKAPLSIIKYPDPRLRAVNGRIGVFDDVLQKFAADLFDAMYNGDDGVGLAAPQVGVNVRLMVFNETGRRGSDQEMVLVNPKIVSSNKQQSHYEEGCLSFPRIFADVERPTQVKVKAQALDGSKFSLTLTGFPARIFQHEYDHLQMDIHASTGTCNASILGVLFHDRMRPQVLQTIKPDLYELEDAFKSAHPDVPIQTVR